MAISVATREERQQPGDAEHADADPGLLALLGQLGLGEPQLAADQLGDLLGQPVHEGAERLVRGGRVGMRVGSCGDRRARLRPGG